jgi:hypothetical protein
MATYEATLKAYKRAPSPRLDQDTKRYYDRELAKLEEIIRLLVAAIEEIKTENP